MNLRGVPEEYPERVSEDGRQCYLDGFLELVQVALSRMPLTAAPGWLGHLTRER